MLARKLRSPASLLPLWDIVDDTIVTTQGCYVRGLELVGLDSEHLPSDVLVRAAERLYDGAKADLVDETFLQFMVLGHANYDDLWSRFEGVPAATDDLLELQRARRLGFLKGLRAPRFSTYAFCGSLRGFTRREFKQLSRSLHLEKLGEAKGIARNLAALLERVDVIARPLSEADIIRLFRDGISDVRGPELGGATLELVPGRASGRWLSRRERLMDAAVTWDDDHVRVGRRYAKVLTLKALPDATQFTLMELFLHLRGDFRLSVMFAVPRQPGAESSVRVARRLANANAHREQHVQDAVRVGHLREANVLAELLAETKQKLVMGGMQLVLWADSREALEARVQAAMDHLRPYQLAFVEETRRHDREYFKTLPGMATSWDRWKLMPSNNAVDLMPLFGSCHGDRRPVFLVRTSRGELFSYDPVEPSRDNWNACVFGASGAGKSVFMNMLITTAMLANHTRGRLMVVDFAGEKKSSYLMVAKLFGGQFIPIVSEGRAFSINPFPRKRDAMTDGEIAGDVLSFLTVLADMLLSNTDEDKDAQLYRLILQRGIVDTYRRLPDEDQAPTFSDLFGVLKAYERDDEVDQDRLSSLVRLLGGVLELPAAALFNSPTSVEINSNFVVFDLFGIEQLSSQLQQAVAFLVCHYVKRLAFDAHDPGVKYVVLDEVAQLLRRREMMALVHELYSTARKHNTSIWTVTQKYTDYVASAVAGTINLNSTTQLFLSHASAASLREEIARDFEMNERERYLFESLRTKKGDFSEALLRTEIWDEAREEKRRISAKLRIELSPFDYELATSDAKDRDLQAQFLELNPGVPVAQVLEAVAAWKRAKRGGVTA